MAHPDDRPIALHWDDDEPRSSSDDCPDCGHGYMRQLGEARACWWCGYYRAAPPADADILGILGRGSYKRLRPRLRHLVRRLSIGTVVGQVNGRELLRELARDLQVNWGCVLEHEKVIDEATHMILLGEFSSEIKERIRVLEKPLRVIIKGRWLAPPGGWPKRPRWRPEDPPPVEEDPDPEGSPFCFDP